MCGTSVRSRQQKTHIHPSQLKIFRCGVHHVCAFSFIFYCVSCGVYCNAADGSTDSIAVTTALKLQNNFTTASTTTEGANDDIKEDVRCDDSGCYVKISSSKQALENMIAATRHLYEDYAMWDVEGKILTEDSLDDIVEDMKPKVPESDHDHGEESESNQDNDGEETIQNGEPMVKDQETVERNESESPAVERESDWFYDDVEDVPCYSSVKDLTQAYFNSTRNLQLNFSDFLTLLPQFVLDSSRNWCEEDSHHHHDHGTETAGESTNSQIIWLISFGSVLGISVVSLLGVLAVPMLRYSKVLNYVISYLVALAVGTLSGDALLHLLPHASGLHDHGAHGHDHDHAHAHGKEEKDHFDSMWKGLVACMGIYCFFLIETGMGFLHRRKQRTSLAGKHCHDRELDCKVDSTPSDENRHLGQGDSAVTPSMSPLLKVNGKHDHEVATISPLINENICVHDELSSKRNGRTDVEKMAGEPIETGHHHHHSNEVPKTIASLAWMVIIGDGLHNMTDGLAIGAAFSNGIGVGLGTVLAIFCHEIPQELADFAVLLNAGMTVKQALFWNFLSACTCFVGLIIGLLLGEYTNGIILWVLAFTAGGFLYIALVDMLPTLMKQQSQQSNKLRFLIQNLGMLSGFGVMVLIALKEESFATTFA